LLEVTSIVEMNALEVRREELSVAVPAAPGNP
jgi:hypothetical protein